MIEVLEASQDAARWRELLAEFPSIRQDIYFQPDYIELHRFDSKTRACLFTFRQGSSCWIHPFLMRPIEQIGTHVVDPGLFDIETAYGYGGPLANTDDQNFLAEAHTSYSGWCREQGVIAEFVRFHPVLETQRWAGPQIELIYDRETFSIDLAALAGNRLPYSGNGRNSLRRAERLGLIAQTTQSASDWARFEQLYRQTMKRLEADAYYYFNEAYFANLAEIVKRTGWLLTVGHNNQWSSAGLFLKGTRGLHYHLSAADPDAYVPGAGNLMLHRAAQLGHAEGLAWLHLGGGFSSAADDPLRRFKQSMSTRSHAFYIGKRIHQEDLYAQLRERWQNEYPDLVKTYGHRLLCYRYQQ